MKKHLFFFSLILIILSVGCEKSEFYMQDMSPFVEIDTRASNITGDTSLTANDEILAVFAAYANFLSNSYISYSELYAIADGDTLVKQLKSIYSSYTKDTLELTFPEGIDTLIIKYKASDFYNYKDSVQVTIHQK